MSCHPGMVFADGLPRVQHACPSHTDPCHQPCLTTIYGSEQGVSACSAHLAIFTSAFSNTSQFRVSGNESGQKGECKPAQPHWWPGSRQAVAQGITQTHSTVQTPSPPALLKTKDFLTSWVFLTQKSELRNTYVNVSLTILTPKLITYQLATSSHFHDTVSRDSLT